MKDAISKQSRLRSLLYSDGLEFLLEAHNGISARIVEESGFAGIWASGLAMSAQFGVRDNNEASWTQVVEMLEFMSDVTNIPILLDGDTGYGNFNNMRRLVRKLEQRNIGGVCIEDKQFPKTNSFINGDKQALADIDEFCGKIKAGKDSQENDDFCIVARIEALIAGWGIKEAIRRGEAYHAAGADAVLIHSRKTNPVEILEFASEWSNRCPLVIVPTKYYSTPVEVYKKASISTVIWANHMIRACIAAMERTGESIRQNNSVIDVEDDISSIDRLFELQGADELNEANEKYLKSTSESSAIVLAASRGNALHELTEDRPKVMLEVNGVPLLERLAREFRKQGINNINVVAGYKAESINVPGIRVELNVDYQTSGELVSLACARHLFTDNMVITYGDLLFRSYILNDLIAGDGEICIVVDSTSDSSPVSGMPDYAYCTLPDDRSIFRQNVNLKYISEKNTADNDNPSGRWIGLMFVRGKGKKWLDEAISRLETREEYRQLTIPDLLNFMVEQGHPVKTQYINGHWLDINALGDLERAGRFIQGRRQTKGKKNQA